MVRGPSRTIIVYTTYRGPVRQDRNSKLNLQRSESRVHPQPQRRRL
jgi:hypothetical protein